MASVDVQHPPAQEVVPALPDYLTSPNAVLGDKDAEWRYGRAPDYSKTRKVYAESKFSNLTTYLQRMPLVSLLIMRSKANDT